jgi:hypothetical protein
VEKTHIPTLLAVVGAKAGDPIPQDWAAWFAQWCALETELVKTPIWTNIANTAPSRGINIGDIGSGMLVVCVN